jgi:NADPH:quinone reductase
MKAIIISSHGGPEVLTVTELPDPVPAADEVLIAVRAFGLNHAEAYMRSGSFGEVAKVTGIECAGTVVTDPSGRLAAGAAVVAILGGMGRTRNGSYAELVTVPASNVVEVKTSLPWTDLVALPEVYATAWAGLRQNLDLRPGQTVLIRGATSALGQAAVNVAAEQGATVIATTRNPERAALLERIGAKAVLVDDGRLADQEFGVADCVLDLVGNSVLRDSLRAVRPRGRVCQLGFLGGLEPVADFNPIADLPSGVQFSFYGSAFVLGTSDFPLTEIPLAELIGKAESGIYQAKPARVFGFDEIVEAHRVMESGLAGGKMTVSVP